MIKIYTTTTCAYCKMVKQFLTLKGKEYEEINIDEQPEKAAEVQALSGTMSVPVTTDGDAVIIGWQPKQLMGLL